MSESLRADESVSPQPPVNRHEVEPSPRPVKSKVLWLPLVGLLGLLFVVIICWQIVVRITDDKGNVKELEVPKGGKVEIVERPGLKKLPEEKKPNLVTPQVYVPVTLEEKDARKQQADWAAKLKVDVETKSKRGIVMVLIPPAGEALPKPYLLGKYEVTQGEWEAVMGYNPSDFKKVGPGRMEVEGIQTSRFPVENVSWFDSVEFCNKLSEKEGLKPYYELLVVRRAFIQGKESKQIAAAEVKIVGGTGYHLPTDAEWEYGCRAGSKSKYHFGDKDQELAEYAWFDKKRPHSVGELKPNAFGLFDMHGNVREWNEEMHLTNELTGGPDRMTRGGSWLYPAGDCAVSGRSRHDPAWRLSLYGLRLARVP